MPETPKQGLEAFWLLEATMSPHTGPSREKQGPVERSLCLAGMQGWRALTSYLLSDKINELPRQLNYCPIKFRILSASFLN